MKGILIGEGKNDTTFVRQLYKFLGHYMEEVRFNAEDELEDPSQLIPKESEIIRRVLSSQFGPDTILLKSEQGKGQFKKSIGALLHQICSQQAYVAFLIDLDEDPLQRYIDDIESRVQKTKPKTSLAEYPDVRISNDDFISTKYKLKESGEFVDSFGLIAFKNDVEAATGLSKYDDDEIDRELCREVVFEYLENNPEYASQAMANLK